MLAISTPFAAVLAEFRARFPEHGTFGLLPGESIDRVVTMHRVPRKPAAYIVSAVGGPNEAIYIGKAGTLRNDGTWKDQTLARRLCARHDGICRRDYWRKTFVDLALQRLTFEWFVTVDNKVTLPAFAEPQLLQAFFDAHGRLPLLNKSV